MRPRDYIRTIEARLQELQRNRREDCLRIAFDLTAQVRLRVQSSGRNFREQPFTPYTPGYAKRRARAGYQVEYVDFTRTGRLWASVRPDVIQEDRDSVTVQVTARTAGDQDKLRGAVRKRGNILLPSADELAIASEANRRRIEKYIAI